MKEAKTEFHSDTVRRSLLDRLVVLRPSWNTCKNMRIVTRRRLPGPIGRGGSESGGIHDFRVIEAGNQNAKNVFSMVRKNFYTIGNDFFFFIFSSPAFTLSGNSSTVTGYVLGEAAVLNASASGLMVKSRWKRKKYESERYVDICCTCVRILQHGQILWQLMLTNVPSRSSGKQHRTDRFGCSCTCTPLESGASGIHLASLPLDHCHTFLSIHTCIEQPMYIHAFQFSYEEPKMYETGTSRGISSNLGELVVIDPASR